MQKFDVILANPPYDNGLHEKFSIKYFDICDGEICWVSPLSFLLGKRQNKKLTVHLDKYMTDIEQINGNEYFDAAIGGTMGIVYVDMNIDNQGVTFDGKDYDKCEEITTYSNDDLIMEFKSIVEPLYIKDNLNTYIKGVPGSHYKALYVKNPNENWYCVKIPRFAGSGNIGSSDTSFYTIFSKNATTKNHIGLYKHLINTPKFDFYIILKNIFECTNFFNYAKGYFCRICLYLNKTNIENVGGSTLKTIPMFNFSDSIFEGTPEEIDMALFKKYNVSQEIIDHILEILPNYYDLDLTKYKG